MSRKRTTLAAVRDELKNDIAGVRAELKNDIAGARAELKDDIAGVHAELKSEIAATRRELALEIVRTQAGLDDMKAGLTAEIKANTDRVLGAIQDLAGKYEDQRNAVILHGRILTDVQVSLKDHAQRIAALEARPNR